MSNTIFSYNGNEITFFQNNSGSMINATEMAKPFDKKVNNWLRLDSAKEFLQALENQRFSHLSNAENQLITTVQGGLEQGTWMHEDVALEFARWLSPEFAVWTNRKLKELLTQGQTSIKRGSDQLPSKKDLAQWVIDLSNEKERVEQEAKSRKRAYQQIKPKADFADQLTKVDGLVSMAEAAKVLHLPYGRNTLYKNLRGKGIFFANKNEPKQYYVNQGYFVLKERWINPDKSDPFTVITAYVTQKGLEYLHKKFKT